MNVISYIMDGRMSAKIYNPLSVVASRYELKELQLVQKILNEHKEDSIYLESHHTLKKGQT